MTTNRFLDDLVRRLKIPNFRGVFMSNELPAIALADECGILNLDSSDGPGTHWTCWFVSSDTVSNNGQNKTYFDSYGAGVPVELQQYLGPSILHTDFQVQQFGSNICGDLCVLLLLLQSKGRSFTDIILDMVLL
jgi:hypothetical protein